MTDTVAIIGLGSAGQRHMRNAWALGLNVVGYDPAHTNAVIHDEGWANSARLYPSIDALLDNSLRPDGLLGVIIATPPQTHYSVATEIASLGDFPCLIEKPLSTKASFGKTIIDAFVLRAPITVGYQFRHIPQLKRLAMDIGAGKYGTIFSAHVEFSSRDFCSFTYLEDFLLETSHELDLLGWMLGTPKEACAHIHGDLATGEIDFAHCQATFHLDGISPDYRRRLVLYGTKGTAFWNFDHEENEGAYALELEDFVRVCRGEKLPECTAEDGYWALRMVEAIKRSAGSGRWETV